MLKIISLVCVLLIAYTASSQVQPAESLAAKFWEYIKADSSAFALKKEMGHSALDAVQLSEAILSASLQFGKPVAIDRKRVKESTVTNGLIGKGRYVCFNYRNKYSDPLTGEHIIFEKLLFYKKDKEDELKLVQYKWSARGTDIDCD
jgi:hypothetical protein